MIASLYQYRRYVWRNAVAELRHRYSGTGLGVFWNVISPLAQIAIYAVVFTKLMAVRMPGGEGGPHAFVIYLCAGLLPWMSFAETITRGANSFVENAAYLKKLPVPEVVFVAQTAISATLSLLISLGLLAVVTIALGHAPTWRWLLVPVAVLMWQMMAFGMGLALGTLNAFLRDVAQVLNVILLMWMWTLPIVYTIETPPMWVRHILPANPPYAFVRAVHDLFVFDRMPPTWIWLAMVAWTTVSVAAGFAALRALRAELRDVI
jgi:lipopolysaccharide transport system permease protein